MTKKTSPWMAVGARPHAPRIASIISCRLRLRNILESDLLLLSFPLYCYGMPAPLKALMDRTLPLSSMAMQRVGDRYEHVGQADYSHLRYLMVCGCGFPNSTRNFEPAVAQFKLMFPANRTIVTVPEAPMFNAPEAAAVPMPRLELVRRAGLVKTNLCTETPLV